MCWWSGNSQGRYRGRYREGRYRERYYVEVEDQRLEYDKKKNRKFEFLF